jgi:hypothetical protein
MRVHRRYQLIPARLLGLRRICNGIFVHVIGHDEAKVEACCLVQSRTPSCFVRRRRGRRFDWALHALLELQRALLRHREYG